MKVFDPQYRPKSFCREFVDVKGTAIQLGMIMSTVLGIKPLMDDWIPANKIDDYKAVCKSYGLKLREDVIFLTVAKNQLQSDIVGRECLTTTLAYALPIEKDIIGLIHVFISKSEKMLEKGMWYPVIIKDRVIFSPIADLLRYGYVLGYPDCCIRFFRTYNNWNRYSHLYEIYINTKSRPSFLCNPLMKDTSFSYIYHMPCSFSCAQTMSTVSRLRQEIKKREPGYVALTDRYLKMPFLVFYEKKYYCFEGALKGNEIKYKNCHSLFSDPSLDIYDDDFKKADTLRLEGRRIILSRRNRAFRQINVVCDKFAPEHPFLIQFKG